MIMEGLPPCIGLRTAFLTIPCECRVHPVSGSCTHAHFGAPEIWNSDLTTAGLGLDLLVSRPGGARGRPVELSAVPGDPLDGGSAYL